ncbi:phage portal protein [uncultured Algoriphagus sp.]|uniref:phage portal protein n=1 Tax=uncultured Algoriphagus sp. TaxID=417365 RepID=UPI0030EBFBED|tara:strand:- start:130839 stop:131201 length:363 start_codon:yes stop_codon:yes gene_type:complete
MLAIKVLDHILITIPANTRELAREFYIKKLLLEEIPGQHPNGAIWLKLGNIELHIREEDNHQSNSSRHPAFVVENLDDAKSFLQNITIPVSFSSVIDGRDRCFFRDPWGNRFELIEFDPK